MAIASLLLICLDYVVIPAKIEAMLQNLCAGLILAAVAVELFPILMDSHTASPTVSCLAIIVGFSSAIGLIYGVNELMSEQLDDIEAKSMASEKIRPSLPSSAFNRSYQSISNESEMSDHYFDAPSSDYDEDAVELSVAAFVAMFDPLSFSFQ